MARLTRVKLRRSKRADRMSASRFRLPKAASPLPANELGPVDIHLSAMAAAARLIIAEKL
jgi:hypothetical protein